MKHLCGQWSILVGVFMISFFFCMCYSSRILPWREDSTRFLTPQEGREVVDEPKALKRNIKLIVLDKSPLIWSLHNCLE